VPSPAPPSFDPAFAPLCENPAARSLPLLCALARGEPGTQTLPYLQGQLRLELRP
jgi:hypothetical protein